MEPRGVGPPSKRDHCVRFAPVALDADWKVVKKAFAGFGKVKHVKVDNGVAWITYRDGEASAKAVKAVASAGMNEHLTVQHA